MQTNNKSKYAIGVYLQHCFAHSMTFIYRQIKGLEEYYDSYVICSDWLENVNKFPIDKLYFKSRNFIKIKKSKVFSKLYGPYNLLFLKPKLSSRQINYFKNILLENNIRLIHAHFGPAGMEIKALADELGIPLIVSFHGYDASQLLDMKEYRKNIKCLFNNTYLIAVSDYMKNRLISIGAPKDKIYVIRYGIPLDYFNHIQRVPVSFKMKMKDKITFLQVSNFVEKKGHKYTILAFANFLRQYKNAKLILAGTGELKENMEKICRELNLMEFVEFPGLVNTKEVRALMNKADVFLHHSITSENGDQEGIPNVIMEAMATGLPIISTYHSGIPELVDNNYNGFLVNEKDVDSFIHVLIGLENAPEDVGIRARAKIESSFNLSTQNQKLLQLYDSVISR